MIVPNRLIAGIDVVLGLDVIDRLGGATIAKGQAKFGNQSASKMTRSATRNNTIQPSKPRLCLIEHEEFWPILMVINGQKSGDRPQNHLCDKSD